MNIATALLDTLGFCPRACDLTPRDGVAALNLARRAAETPRTGRTWARVLRSERRLFKRMAPLMGRGIVIGGIPGTK
jgi:hypothetical protein